MTSISLKIVIMLEGGGEPVKLALNTVLKDGSKITRMPQRCRMCWWLCLSPAGEGHLSQAYSRCSWTRAHYT